VRYCSSPIFVTAIGIDKMFGVFNYSARACMATIEQA